MCANWLDDHKRTPPVESVVDTVLEFFGITVTLPESSTSTIRVSQFVPPAKLKLIATSPLLPTTAPQTAPQSPKRFPTAQIILMVHGNSGFPSAIGQAQRNIHHRSAFGAGDDLAEKTPRVVRLSESRPERNYGGLRTRFLTDSANRSGNAFRAFVADVKRNFFKCEAFHPIAEVEVWRKGNG